MLQQIQCIAISEFFINDLRFNKLIRNADITHLEVEKFDKREINYQAIVKKMI